MASAAVPAADERPAAFVAFGLEPIAFLGYFQHYYHPSPLLELETSCWKEGQNSQQLHQTCFQTSFSDLFSQATMDTVLVVTVALCWFEITDLIFVTNQNYLNSDLFLCCQQKRWDSSLHITKLVALPTWVN